MVDDSYYITPHETALAVVATAMKKARLQLDTLIVNSIMGGIFFSAGGMLFLSCHANNPEILANNPGMLDYLGALTFSIGLFYVIINGTDLFNSNILFFTVGVLRKAVSIYDLLISWVISWFFNLGGTLFVSYVICHLSNVTRTEGYITASRQIVAEKASFSFIETFIKGIAGNFYVCLAVYLQLMAKPIHVKFILMTLPIFTFVAMGFTHAVADMYLLTAGMINGADLSVGKLIWKLFIPSILGNIVGGCGFSIIVPFYLHLVVVERDRRKLALPQYDARDEQPELNVDSRVVRISSKEAKEEEDEADIDEELDSDEKNDTFGHISSDSSVDPRSEAPLDYRPEMHNSQSTLPSVARTMSALSRLNSRGYISKSRPLRSHVMRSPPGVFPVRGMGAPLTREMTIADEGSPPRLENQSSALQNPNPSPNLVDKLQTSDGVLIHDDMNSNLDVSSILSSPSLAPTMRSGIARKLASHNDRKLALHEVEKQEEEKYDAEGGYNVLENKLGSKLEKVLTKIASHASREGSASPQLPKTTQELFPHHRISRTHTITNATLSHHEDSIGSGLHELFRTVSRSLTPSTHTNDIHDIYRRLSEAGITNTAANAADNIAGIDNYNNMNLPSPHTALHNKHFSHPTYPSPVYHTSPVNSAGTYANSDSIQHPLMARQGYKPRIINDTGAHGQNANIIRPGSSKESIDGNTPS